MIKKRKEKTEAQKEMARERCRRYRLQKKAKMNEEQKEAQRAKDRERSRRYRRTEKGKARHKACSRRWYARNKDKLSAKQKEYRARMKADPIAYEHYKALQREYERKRRRREGDDYMADKYACLMEWREKNRERYRAYSREYQRKYRAAHGTRYEKVKERMERDAEVYARIRAAAREKTRRKAEAEGREYVPRPYRRIPDTMRKGEFERFVTCTQEEMFFRDATAYAAHRERRREIRRRRVEAAGREYKPRMARRIPDWCKKGECDRIARSSVYLRENHDEDELMAFDGFKLDLAVERKKRREA